MHDTEDKQYWCDKGLDEEIEFVQNIAPIYGLKAMINPAKETDKYTFDLWVNGCDADLKTVRTPFFTASRYDYDPNRTVTFNVKDLVRYEKLYPLLQIYFYVEWDSTKQYGVQVRELNGLWSINVKELSHWARTGRMPIHEYVNRVGDTHGNARSSFLIDLDDLIQIHPKY